MSKRKAILRELKRAHLRVMKETEKLDIPKAQKDLIRQTTMDLMEFEAKQSTADLEAWLMSLKNIPIGHFDPSQILDDFKN